MRGRPTNAKRWGRERLGSLGSLMGSLRGSMENLIVKKRKEREEEKKEEGDEIDIFRKRERIARSPIRKEEEEEGIKEILIELKNEIKGIREEMREEKKERRKIKELLEGMKEKWGKEKKEIDERIEGIGKRIKELKIKEEKWKEIEERVEMIEKGDRKLERKEKGELEERIRKIEIEVERKERKTRKENIIIRGMKLEKEGEDGIREGVEKLLQEIGVKAELKEVKKISQKDKEGREMIWVKLGNREEKKSVMEKKKNLGRRIERIEDDMTKRERKIQWVVRREAEEERIKGKKVRTGYMKLWVEGKMWKWDEIEEVFRDERGKEKKKYEEREKKQGGEDAGLHREDS